MQAFVLVFDAAHLVLQHLEIGLALLVLFDRCVERVPYLRDDGQQTRREPVACPALHLPELLLFADVAEEDGVDAPHTLQTELVGEAAAVVHHVVDGEDGQQEEDKQGDGHVLVRLRLHHHPAVLAQRPVGVTLLEEVGIDGVVVSVEVPLVQGECGHCALVADVEDDAVVHRHALVEPFYFRWDVGEGPRPLHQLLSLGAQAEVEPVEIVSAGVGVGQRLGVGAVDVGEVSRVGVDAGQGAVVVAGQCRCLVDVSGGACGCRRQGADGKEDAGDRAADAFRQAEEEAASPAFTALHADAAYGEDPADLAVLVDDAVAVHQPEAVRGAVRLVVDGLVVEDVCLLCLGESAARVGDGNLHIAVALRCADGDAAVCRGELPGIVGKGVDHEERQHPVGLDDGGAVSDTEVYAFHLESHASLLHDVEHLLHGEALDVE